jgi:hypothetical protein
MSEKLNDVAAAEAKSIRALTQEIVMSGAYLYPFKVNRFFSRGFVYL